MSRTLRVLAVLTAVFLSWSAARANSPVVALTPDEKEHAVRLVHQLGDRNFRLREAASDQLVHMGRAVEPVLRDGLKYPDAEVRQRCKRLLPLAMNFDLEKHITAFLADVDEKNPTQLAGWARFKELAGNDNTARLLFVDLHRHNGEFMEQIANSPKAAAEKLQLLCQEFMNMFNGNWGRVLVPQERVALMLFAAQMPGVSSDMQAQMTLSSGLYNLSYQQGGKAMLVNNSALRKLLVRYVDRSNSAWSYNNLMLLANLDLREEGVAIAKKVIMSTGKEGHTRSMAISVLGKLGTKENIPDIEPFLNDSTSIGAFRFNNNPQISTQLRDVALANLAKLSGHSLTDYNFPYLKQFPQNVQMDIHSSPAMFGFADEPTRTASIKKWKDWWEKEKPKAKK